MDICGFTHNEAVRGHFKYVRWREMHNFGRKMMLMNRLVITVRQLELN